MWHIIFVNVSVEGIKKKKKSGPPGSILNRIVQLKGTLKGHIV